MAACITERSQGSVVDRKSVQERNTGEGEGRGRNTRFDKKVGKEAIPLGRVSKIIIGEGGGEERRLGGVFYLG